MALPIPYNRLMNVCSFDNRGWGLGGQQGIYHTIYLDDDPTAYTWIDVFGRADHHPVSIKPWHFADQKPAAR